MAKYIVTVLFTNSRSCCAMGVRQSPYFKSQGRVDEFTFKKNGFVLVAERSAVYADGSILTNSQNSLGKQILKGLLVYYALSPDFPKLKSIEIIRKRLSRQGDFVYLETSNFYQPLKPRVQRNFHLSAANIDVCLEESEKGEAVRIALSYWLKAINSGDDYFKFDRLWRAYDRLLLYQGNSNKEIDGIRAIKALIKANAALFQESISLTSTYTYDYIRKFRWNKLLYSKSKKYNNVGEIVRLAKEYTDKRAICLYKNLVAGPKVSVALSPDQTNDVQAHFTAHNATVNEIDIVQLMSLTYTYYIRCKMFHGEVSESTFKLKQTDEDWEIHELVQLLEKVVYELLNNNNILRG